MGEGRPRLRSVDSEQLGRVNEPRNDDRGRADVVDIAEGYTRSAVTAWRGVCRGRRAWHVCRGFPRNLGDLTTPNHSRDRMREPGKKTLGPHCPGATGQKGANRESWAMVRYRRVKATERGGKGVEESEHSIVPLKQGNQTAGTLWREGSAGC